MDSGNELLDDKSCHGECPKFPIYWRVEDFVSCEALEENDTYTLFGPDYKLNLNCASHGTFSKNKEALFEGAQTWSRYGFKCRVNYHCN